MLSRLALVASFNVLGADHTDGRHPRGVYAGAEWDTDNSIAWRLDRFELVDGCLGGRHVAFGPPRVDRSALVEATTDHPLVSSRVTLR